jgi:glycopeptide antibiotics resistance protein
MESFLVGMDGRRLERGTSTNTVRHKLSRRSRPGKTVEHRSRTGRPQSSRWGLRPILSRVTPPSPSPRPIAPPSAPLPSDRTGARLGAALLAFVLAVVLVITLQPFEFRWPTSLRVSTETLPFDVVANVALFVPLGFLYRLARPPGGRLPRQAAARVFALGLALSGVVECAQLLEADRFASPVDVLTNGLGALLGAWLHAALSARLRAGAQLVGRLALELPLVSLVYLLVPLCVLDALTVGDSVARLALLAALGLFGASILGAVQGAYLAPAGLLSARAAAAAAAGWFLVGALPAVAARPALVVPLMLGVAATAWLRATRTERAHRAPAARADRRFELDALRTAAPFYGAYLMLLPLTTDVGALEGLTRLTIFRAVESLTAFVVLGFVLAEALGRGERPYRDDARVVALWSLAAALVSAVLHAGGLPTLAAAPGVLVSLAASTYGGWLYHLQRAHVRCLVNESGREFRQTLGAGLRRAA